MLKPGYSVRLLTAGLLLLTLVACGAKPPATGSTTQTERVSGGRSGVFVVDTLVANSADARKTRRAALLGVFVSHFLSNSPTAIVNGGIQGITVQTAIFEKQSSVSDPDFDLIQAFADALQVDVLDLLNRSLDRQATLDVYYTSLENVAQRANTRLAELMAADDTQTEELRALNRERADLDRELRNATNDKDYLLANEKQKALNEKERQISEAELKLDQIKNVSQTLEDLMKLYGDKSLAIQENREPLIAGTKVVDLPGTLDLKILERPNGRSSGTTGTTRTSGTSGGSTGGSAGGSTGGTTRGSTSGGSSTGGTSGGSGTASSTSSKKSGSSIFGNPFGSFGDGKSSSNTSGGSTGGSTSGGSTGGNSSSRPGNLSGGSTNGGTTGGSTGGTNGGTTNSSSSRSSSGLFNTGGGTNGGTTGGTTNGGTTNGGTNGGTTGGATNGGGTNGGTTGGTTNGGTTGGATTTTGDGAGGGVIDVGALLEGGDGSVNELVSIVIAMLLIAGLFLCLIYLVWGGIKFITSAGNEENIKKAGATIRYALLGLVVCLLGYFIVWWLAILLDAPFDLSFSHILDLMSQLYQHFSQPLE
ncbi:MAG TPA: hypothetical protein PKV72_00360 [Candidatus Peribacteria bacterium]|nr:hypothetical protein [Candidatus Peribacteria bacterium]